MSSANRLLILPAIALLLAVTACSQLLIRESSLPESHAEALGEGSVDCSECHEDQLRGSLKPYASFNHNPLFVKNHRFYAARDDRLCASCHKASFCTDCHANETELKPSLMFGERPDRTLIHRGDYLAQHTIDGKLNPGSCYKCHGRLNNEKCLSCHR